MSLNIRDIGPIIKQHQKMSSSLDSSPFHLGRDDLYAAHSPDMILTWDMLEKAGWEHRSFMSKLGQAVEDIVNRKEALPSHCDSITRSRVIQNEYHPYPNDYRAIYANNIFMENHQLRPLRGMLLEPLRAFNQ